MVSMGATDQRDTGEDLTFILNVRKEYLLTTAKKAKIDISENVYAGDNKIIQIPGRIRRPNGDLEAQ